MKLEGLKRSKFTSSIIRKCTNILDEFHLLFMNTATVNRFPGFRYLKITAMNIQFPSQKVANTNLLSIIRNFKLLFCIHEIFLFYKMGQGTTVNKF
jgi:hypothetical protein